MYQLLPDGKPEKGLPSPDYARFSTPIWPKAHTLSLKPENSYPYATAQQLQDESETLRNQHYPLRAIRDDTGRLAGTQGRSDFHHTDDTYNRAPDHDRQKRLDALGQQVEDILADRYKADKTLGEGKDWSPEERAKVEGLIEKVRQDGEGRDEALKQLLEDPDVVLSIREIKQLVKNWRLEYPLVSRGRKLVSSLLTDIQLHGNTRYVVPYASPTHPYTPLTFLIVYLKMRSRIKSGGVKRKSRTKRTPPKRSRTRPATRTRPASKKTAKTRRSSRKPNTHFILGSSRSSTCSNPSRTTPPSLRTNESA